MPIILPDGLAAADLLRAEGIEVLHRSPRAGETLRIGLLNLMPDMLSTEMQFARLLAAADRHVEIVLAVPSSYRVGRESTALYQRWGETSLPHRLDGLIVTGAPLELIPFEDVRYWRELACIFDWATRSVGSTFYVCWAAFAAMYLFHGTPKRVLPHKLSGVFQQQVVETTDPLMRGLTGSFPCPVSRHAAVEARDVPWHRGLSRLAWSLEAGLCLIGDGPLNGYYMFNHLEYDAHTLRLEQLRDNPGLASDRSPSSELISRGEDRIWRVAAEAVFANWLAVASGQTHLAGDRAQANLNDPERNPRTPACRGC
jgi:homoserine O-succinyltransferase/O-acetyltransferase